MIEGEIILVICKILQESRIVKLLFINRSNVSQLQNMLNQPSTLNKICLFLDEVVFIDVGKHRQSLINGLLRRISQVLANQTTEREI